MCSIMIVRIDEFDGVVEMAELGMLLLDPGDGIGESTHQMRVFSFAENRSWTCS